MEESALNSLARLYQEKLAEDPFSGCVSVFRSHSGTAIRLLTYDGQRYWLAQKRLSKGKFSWWPEAVEPAKAAGSVRRAAESMPPAIQVPESAVGRLMSFGVVAGQADDRELVHGVHVSSPFLVPVCSGAIGKQAAPLPIEDRSALL